MAKIYPSNLDLEIIRKHSKAEAKIYEACLNLDNNKTKDWIIFYSYLYKDNSRVKINNEIDFLILAPNIGIFTLEVKGGDIKRIDGNIYSIDKNNKFYLIDPFNQSKSNYYGISKVVGDLSFGNINDGFIKHKIDHYYGGYLVAFPDISTRPNFGVGTKDTIYISGDNLYEFILKNSKKCRDVKENPTKEVINKIFDRLNGDKNFIYSMNTYDYISSINLRINDLTQEQESVFDGLLNNKRCLIEGGAGTGKTVLAQFLMNKLMQEKKSVIYFTFNRLISHKVSKELEKNKNNSSKCYPIIDYLEDEYVRLTNKPLNIENYNEKKDFLLANVGKLLEENIINSITYDCVIIDEAQDIDLTDDIIIFLDAILNGGIKNGYCYLFYDNNQKIFGERKGKKVYDSEYFNDGNEGYRYAKFLLKRNCRNGNNIKNAMQNILFSGKDFKFSKLINEDISFEEFEKNSSDINDIIDDVNYLLSDGVKKNQITFLFNLKVDNNNILNILKEYYKNDLLEYTEENIQKIKLTYATVSSFKGLENDIIFYINDNFRANKNNHYVAISRAKVKAFIYKII